MCLLHMLIQEFSPRGEGGEGVQAEKKLHCLEKNSGKLFFCFSPNLQLLNSFTEVGVPFFLFDLILFVPSTIFQLYRCRSSWIEPVLSYYKCVLLKDHNAEMPVKLEAASHMSRVKHSTTELPEGVRCFFKENYIVFQGSRGDSTFYRGGGGECIETYRN